MNKNNLLQSISDGHYDKAFISLYGDDADTNSIHSRYHKAASEFLSLYGHLLDDNSEICLFSVPGRSEICGNHTDHNHGCVLAASINLDIIAVAAKTNTGDIRIKSEGFNQDVVSVANTDVVNPDEKYKASAIIRGMCDGFNKKGLKTGAFCAYTTSNVLKGSGLSSSAAFEVMVGNILNHLYNEGKEDPVEIAKISQYAENVHFGKPCGLMDQTACAVGGFVAIDFQQPQNPKVEKLSFDIAQHDYSLCIINTGGNHADLNEDYASVPAEMKAVANFFGKDVLRQVSKAEIIANAKQLRENCGDRAFLRAVHFCNENALVQKQTQSLKNNNMQEFLEGVNLSGLSSISKLQNIFTVKNVKEQGLALALALAGEVLDQYGNCAYRVHGGGFAGTIQVFCKNGYVNALTSAMNGVFGQNASYVLTIRQHGAVKLENLL